MQFINKCVQVWFFLQNMFGLSPFRLSSSLEKPTLSILGVIMAFINMGVYYGIMVFEAETAKDRLDPIKIFGTKTAQLGPVLTDLVSFLTVFTNFLPVLLLYFHRQKLINLLNVASQEVKLVAEKVNNFSLIISYTLRIVMAAAYIVFLVWYTVGTFYDLGRFIPISYWFFFKVVSVHFYKFLIIFDFMIVLLIVERMFRRVQSGLENIHHKR